MSAGHHSIQDRVAGLLPLWRNWLRIKHRQLHMHHDDIVQEAAADLLSWSKDRALTLDEDTLRRVGFRILQRRVTDAVRSAVKHWANEEPSIEWPDTSADVDPALVLELKQRLRLLMAVLSEFDAEERAMLVGAEIGRGSEFQGPMNATTRKRLARLRERVSTALEARGWRGASPWPPVQDLEKGET